MPEPPDAPRGNTRQLVFRPGDNPLDIAAEWVARPALRQLVEAFGGTWPADSDLEQKLRALVAFSDIWDRRKGGSRLDIGDIAAADAGPYSCVPGTADALGLVSQPPPGRMNPTYAAILGGLAVGNLSRISYYRELAGRGLAPAKALILLGSFRRLREEETAALGRHAPGIVGADSEVAMLSGAARQVCLPSTQWHETHGGDPVADPDRAWLHAWGDETPSVHVFAAPSSDPGARPANTADTLAFAAETMRFDSSDYILLLTSAIYSVYQFFDSVRVLGLRYGVAAEVIGVPPERALASQSPAAQAQEIRSCLRSALALVRAAKKHGLGSPELSPGR